MGDEKGSTLIQVLLIILIFSVLGISLLGNVVGENKRVNKTNDIIQGRNLARDGLTYFEKDFQSRAIAPTPLSIYEFLTAEGEKSYLKGKEIEVEHGEILITVVIPEKMTLKEVDNGKEANAFILKVISQGVEPETEGLVGYYTLDFDFEEKAEELLNFDEGKAVDFSEALLSLGTLDLSNLNVNLKVNLLLVEIDVGAVLKPVVAALAGLLPVKQVHLDLLKLSGNNEDFYQVPDDKILGGLAGLSQVSLGLIDVDSGHAFTTFEDNQVIAVRNSSLLNLSLSESIHLRTDLTAPENVTNVLIDGEFSKLNVQLENLSSQLTSLVNLLLGDMQGVLKSTLTYVLTLVDSLTGIVSQLVNQLVNQIVTILTNKVNNIEGFLDIHFLKFGVTGKALIKQNPKDTEANTTPREFSFIEGLVVKDTLNVGGFKGEELNKKSNLMLNGEMLTLKNLQITYADYETINNNVYVMENADIEKSCINPQDNDQDFRLFVKGNLVINNDSDCNKYNGLFYAKGMKTPETPERQKDITIHTHDKNMTIDGLVIGELDVQGTGTVEINVNPLYLQKVEMKNANLISLGRTYE